MLCAVLRPSGRLLGWVLGVLGLRGGGCNAGMVRCTAALHGPWGGLTRLVVLYVQHARLLPGPQTP